MQNRVTRAISIALSIVCLAIAALLQRKPAAAVQEIVSPSTKILLADSLPKEDDQLLARKVSQLDFTDAPLEAVVQKLRGLTGTPIFTQGHGPELSQIPEGALVTVHLKDVTLREALRAVVDSLGQHHIHDLDFSADEDAVTIGHPDQLRRYVGTQYFDFRELAYRLVNGASWLMNPRPPVGQSGYARVQDDIDRWLTDVVDANSWHDAGGTSGQIRDLGGLLIVTQTPKNLREIQPMLDAMTRAAMPESAVFQRIRRVPATQNADEILFYSITLPHLVEKLELPSSPLDDPQADDPILVLLNQVELLVRFTGGPPLAQDETRSTSQICGKLLLLDPYVDARGIQPLLDALLRAADANDFSPIMVAPTSAQVQAASGKTQALFNVRALMPGLKARRARNPVQMPSAALPKRRQWGVIDDSGLQEYILSHVDRAKWDGAGGGGVFYPMGAVLGVTQTAENIKAVEHALEQLAHELAAESKP